MNRGRERAEERKRVSAGDNKEERGEGERQRDEKMCDTRRIYEKVEEEKQKKYIKTRGQNRFTQW